MKFKLKSCSVLWVWFLLSCPVLWAQLSIPMPYGSGPYATAINSQTNVGVVVNRYTNTLVTFSLTSSTTLGTLKLDQDTDTTKRGLGPISVAINPNTNQAVTANFDSNNITVVNLADPATPVIVGIVAVDKNPRSIAIDLKRNIAIVANLTANNVSLVDIANLKNALPTPIVVGSAPIDVKYLADVDGAVVVNHVGTNTGTATLESLSMIDLKNQVKIGDFPYLNFLQPTSVAADPDKKLMVVTNAQLASSTVSVLDYSKWPTLTGVKEINMGMRPIYVDMNLKSHQAVVLSSDSKTYSLIDLNDSANIFRVKSPLVDVGDGTTHLTVNSANNTVLVSSPLKDSVNVVTLGFQQFFPLAIDTEGFRSNLGINNLGTASANVQVDLLGPDGTVLGSQTVTAVSLGMKQINNVVRYILGREDLTSLQGSLRLTSDQPFTSFVSVIDNISNDPSMEIGHVSGYFHLLVNSVTNTGAYHSYLVVFNPGTNSAALTITLRKPDTGEVVASDNTVIIPANGYFATNDIMGFLKVTTETYGPLEITDGNNNPIIGVSRVYSSSNTGGFFEAVQVQ